MREPEHVYCVEDGSSIYRYLWPYREFAAAQTRMVQFHRLQFNFFCAKLCSGAHFASLKYAFHSIPSHVGLTGVVILEDAKTGQENRQSRLLM